MKNTFYILLMVLFSSCGPEGIRGWWPDGTSTENKGCNRDLTVKWKNNWNKNLIAFFVQVKPDAGIPCESLENFGIIAVGETKSFVINKGMKGFFVFAEKIDGQCSTTRRYKESTVTCENVTYDVENFNISE